MRPLPNSDTKSHIPGNSRICLVYA